MTRRKAFQPDWVSAPGDTIADLLEQRGLSEEFVRDQAGLSESDTAALLGGRLALTAELAASLEAALAVPADFWIAREAKYRDQLKRISDSVSAAPADKWIKQLPITDMVKLGWIDGKPQGNELAACLDFFGTPDLATWRATYREVLGSAAFRRSLSYESNPAAIAAWLRQGERQTARVACGPWDVRRFEATLREVRTLSRRKQPSMFMQELVDKSAACGVAVAVVPTPKGCHVSGATRFVSRHRALLLLSARYRTDDHFWFTFFHEAAHLILHGHRGFFLESPDGVVTSEEKEANAYAADTLVPRHEWARLRVPRTSHTDVLRFARSVGVSPGIVVGQLQHRGTLPRTHLNGLKRHYDWGNTSTMAPSRLPKE